RTVHACVLSVSSRETRIGAKGAACASAISPDFRSSSSARKATACSTRERPATSPSKSNTRRRRRTARNRSRNCATGGKRRAMCERDTFGGGTASPLSASASCAASWCASRRSVRGASGAGPEEALTLLLEPLPQPGGGLLHAPVLGESPGELLGGLLGLELGELGAL